MSENDTSSKNTGKFNLPSVTTIVRLPLILIALYLWHIRKNQEGMLKLAMWLGSAQQTIMLCLIACLLAGTFRFSRYFGGIMMLLLSIASLYVFIFVCGMIAYTSDTDFIQLIGGVITCGLLWVGMTIWQSIKIGSWSAFMSLLISIAGTVLGCLLISIQVWLFDSKTTQETSPVTPQGDAPTGDSITPDTSTNTHNAQSE